MIGGNRIRERVPADEFLDRLTGYGRENVACTEHTFFRLSRKQRELFTCENIRDVLFSEPLVLVGLQKNGFSRPFTSIKAADS